MFDARFYHEVLPERLLAECKLRPGDTLVVVLQLADGAALDLCHLVHLGEEWFSVQYFRDAESCDDMDLAFLPYELVKMVTVSLRHPSARRIGFSLKSEPDGKKGTA
ncbi:MAG: hypothetical protein HY681_04460 [Chloroflexi bacterium]|nr:hypothetical protein [Chloroflexota bacterium]